MKDDILFYLYSQALAFIKAVGDGAKLIGSNQPLPKRPSYNDTLSKIQGQEDELTS